MVSPASIFLLVGPELALVEEEFERQLATASPLVSTIGRHIRESGGKRLRPALLLLTVKLIRGEVSPAAINMAAVMEMLHSATLVHDDILDNAAVRRGRASINAKWGSDVAVLMGDWLYMTAFKMALRERSFDILDLLTSMTSLMTEGEIMQNSLNGNSRVSMSEYLEIVQRKTAQMISACTEIGAIVADASKEQRRNLATYGSLVGVAFQLIDDLLDFVSTEEVLGKPVGSDLCEGKLTLPLIYLLENGDDAPRQMFETVMNERGFGSVTFDAVLRLLHQHDALDRARAEANRYAQEAIDALTEFPSNQFREALFQVPQFIVEQVQPSIAVNSTVGNLDQVLTSSLKGRGLPI